MPSFMQNLDQIAGGKPRIVGGKPAPSMIPWQVSIGGCGGTILDSCTILSAAHCGGITNGTYIRAGSLNFNEGQVSQRISFYLISFFRMHEFLSFRFELSHKS